MRRRPWLRHPNVIIYTTSATETTQHIDVNHVLIITMYFINTTTIRKWRTRKIFIKERHRFHRIHSKCCNIFIIRNRHPARDIDGIVCVVEDLSFDTNPKAVCICHANEDFLLSTDWRWQMDEGEVQWLDQEALACLVDHLITPISIFEYLVL